MKVIVMNNSGFSRITSELTSYTTIKQFYNCEAWDLSEFYGMGGTLVNIEEALQIKTLQDFSDRIERESQKDKIVVVTNMVQSAYVKIHPYLKKYKIPVIDVQKNNFVSFLERKTAFDFSIDIPLKQRIKRILNNFIIFRRMVKYIKYGGVKFDYFLSAFNFSPEEVGFFIKTHNVKYDEYLKYKNSESPESNPYILFIDCATCYHPIDYKGVEEHFDETHHINQLNNYFDLLENKYGIPVIISLHPCSVNHLSSSSFLGRKVTYSQTAYFIQHAKFVVSFFSTSLINVVLAQKPSVILTSKEIESSRRKRQEDCAFVFSKMCGFIIDSLDNPKCVSPKINHTLYESFISNYLVNVPQKDKSNADFLIELLKKIELGCE